MDMEEEVAAIVEGPMEVVVEAEEVGLSVYTYKWICLVMSVYAVNMQNHSLCLVIVLGLLLDV